MDSQGQTHHDDGMGSMSGGMDDMECSMKMLFNLDAKNLCIVFSWWRVNNVGFLILSCFIVALFSVGFEYLRYVARAYDLKLYALTSQSQVENSEELGLAQAKVNRLTYVHRLIRTLIHTVQVILSFFLMLVFMTYNGYLMLSVVIGAAVGYFFFTNHNLLPTEDTTICH